MRLIDADVLVKEAMRSPNYFIIKYAAQKAPTIDAVPATIDGALGYLHKVGWIQEHDRIMTEDVAPVRHGHWIFNQEDMALHCSCCDEVFRFEEDEKDECLDFMEYAKYCLACGAVMDEEVD